MIVATKIEGVLAYTKMTPVWIERAARLRRKILATGQCDDCLEADKKQN